VDYVLPTEGEVKATLDRIRDYFVRSTPYRIIDTATGAPVAVGLSVLLAVLIHVYAERPAVRFLNRRFGGKRKSVEFSDPTSA